MRLSLQTDYAFRTLLYLTGKPARATIPDVAEFYGISEHHLAKVVNLLVRHGYVRGIRGVGGGIELARPPESVRLGDIVVAFEGNLHLLECVGMPNVCVIQPNCRLRGIFKEAERAQLDVLNRYTLADLIVSGQPLAQLKLTKTT